MRTYPILLLLCVACLAFAPAPVYRPKKAEPASSRIVALMEGFRKKIPPDTRGLFAGTGESVKDLEPYTMPHLGQVAVGLGVGTRSECRALMPYLLDPDCKLRFIAQHAIDKATKAYPDGQSIECLLDLESKGHREMSRRFAELIEQMER